MKNETRTKIEQYVARSIDQLQREYLSNDNRAHAAAKLAQLRHAVAKEPGESLDAYMIELGTFGFGSDEQENELQRIEWSIHTALTLYAVHQQSKTSEGMYCKSQQDKSEFYGLGNAMKRLVQKNKQTGRGEQLEEGEMPRRFAAMVTAESVQELSNYARELVKQLRAESIPLDYARFAGQLYDFQIVEKRNKVRLEWGREFVRFIQNDVPTKPENATE